MKEAGKVTAEILASLSDFIKPGMSTWEIDKYVEEEIRRHGQLPAFKGYAGFPATVCASVNEVVVHGIPSKKKILREGDIVSIDMGTVWKGYYSDAARTYAVGTVSPEAAKLIETTERSFFEGLKFAREGYHVKDISHAIQTYVEAQGFSIVREYVGHGVGRKLHEAPEVPNYGESGHGPRLLRGMTLAVEPMVNAGTASIIQMSDGWTVKTADGKNAAHYENTILITDGEPELLTDPEKSLV